MLTFKRAMVYLLLLYASMMTFAEDSITWATPDWSPFYIVDGPNKGEGISDSHRLFFEGKLVDFNHETALMNFSRFFLEVDNNENICLVGLLKNHERNKKVYFSNPFTIGLTQRLIVNKASLSSFGNMKQVSLEDLLQNDVMDVIFIKGRGYQNLNPLIDKYKNQTHVIVSTTNSARLVEMLIQGRVSYLVDYPHLAYVNANSYSNTSDIISLSIKEQSPYFDLHVGCAKNAWGKHVISRINEVIEKYRFTDEYRKVMEVEDNFLDEEGLRIRKHLFNTVFLSR